MPAKVDTDICGPVQISDPRGPAQLTEVYIDWLSFNCLYCARLWSEVFSVFSASGKEDSGTMMLSKGPRIT